MTLIIPYLLKLSICIAVIYLFYQLVLRRLTFYTWNRWYLLLYSALAFLLPFVNLSPVLEKNAWSGNGLIKLIPAVGDYTLMQASRNALSEQRDWNTIIIITCLCIGMLVMMVRLGIQYISLLRLRRSARLIIDDSVKVYQVNKSIIPFSFGNAIYVNQHLHNEDELKEIIRHEFVHVKQRHSLDIVWMELFCLFNWYNPFAWMIRKAMRQNLEFIADRHVLQNGFDRKQYQYLLLKVVGVSSFSIASNFNFSSLKKRIAMMNRTKSARVHVMRFLFALPLLVVVLLAFRNTVNNRIIHNVDGRDRQVIAADTTPAGQKYWRDQVSEMQMIDGRLVTITLKNGQVEKYDLDKPGVKTTFEKKYGKMPEPPVPPAPAPDGEIVELPEPPAAIGMPVPVEGEIVEVPVAPLPRAPYRDLTDCINKKGYCLTVADNLGECVVIVKDKNFKIIEAVKLTDWNNDKKFEDKYGEIPPPPPPPPPGKRVPGKATAMSTISGVHAVGGTLSSVRTTSSTIAGVQVAGGSNLTGVAVDDEVNVGVSAVNVTGTGPAKVGTGAVRSTVSGTGARVATIGSTATVIGDVETIKEEVVIAIIKSSTTREDLDKIQADMKEKGYTLKIDNVDFNDGKLSGIDATVTNGKGGKWHFSATDFKKVTLSVFVTDKGRKDLNIRVSDGKVDI